MKPKAQIPLLMWDLKSRCQRVPSQQRGCAFSLLIHGKETQLVIQKHSNKNDFRWPERMLFISSEQKAVCFHQCPHMLTFF